MKTRFELWKSAVRGMNSKHLVIEIIPRALWLIQIATLVALQYYTDRPPVLTSIGAKAFLGAALFIAGFISWLQIVHAMRHAFFTKELMDKGFFRYIRHPMYVAIYFMLAGLGLLFFSLAWMLTLAAFVPIWYGVCLLEEKQMTELLGEKYIAYKNNTGMFFPKLFSRH